jgi:DNA mismatch endonuclease (patch repair protein)
VIPLFSTHRRLPLAGCKLAYSPKSNRSFWMEKFTANVARDRRQIRDLTGRGWRVTVSWEWTLRSSVSLELETTRLACWLERKRGPTDSGPGAGREPVTGLRACTRAMTPSRGGPI